MTYLRKVNKPYVDNLMNSHMLHIPEYPTPRSTEYFSHPVVPFLSPLTHALSPLLWFLIPQVYCTCVEPFISGHVACSLYVQLFSFNTMFEKFIHTFACCCSIYSTMCFYTINLFILKLINILVVSSLRLLWIVLLWMSQFLIK